MLNNRLFSPRRRAVVASRQRGVVMMVAMIVLVAMTLAGIALTRSMDTTNMIAGNMAFKQVSVQAAYVAMEQAVAFIEANGGSGALGADLLANGYRASVDYAPPSMDTFWSNLESANSICYMGALGCTANKSNAVADALGNIRGYVIERMCQGTTCAVVQRQVQSGGCCEGPDCGDIPCYSNDQMFRITVRVTGPRNTNTYIQTFVTQPS
jgi:Tfp pilus assembly protein PilX